MDNNQNSQQTNDNPQQQVNQEGQNPGWQQPNGGNQGGQNPQWQQPNYQGGQNPQWQQPNGGYQSGQNPSWQQPNGGYQGMPNQGWQQQPQGYQPQYNNMQWQEPPKKKMSTGCIVGIVLGVIFLIGVIVVGILIAMGAMFVNSVSSEFDSIGSEFYNTAFELYLGDSKPADSVYRLMASVEMNNEDDEETNIIDVKITLNDGTVLNYNTYDSDLISRDSYYTISAEKDKKGYINKITITEN